MTTISMYKISVPIFVQFLTSLSAVLDKAAAFAEAEEDRAVGAAEHAACARHVSAGAAGAGGDRSRHQRLRQARRRRAADLSEHRGDHSRAQGAHRQDHRVHQGPQAGADRRHRGQGDQDHVPERRRARVHRAVAAAQQLAAEFLFPLHHRLRHPAPLRRSSSASATSWARRCRCKARTH